MPILRTFSSAASRPFFTPPIEGVNGSNYWEKIEQLSTPAHGAFCLWVNEQITEVYSSGSIAPGTNARRGTRLFIKTAGQWQLTPSNIQDLQNGNYTIGSTETSKSGNRSFGTSGGEFFVFERNNLTWTRTVIHADSIYSGGAVAISSSGNAVFHTAVRISERKTYLRKFENGTWVEKIAISSINSSFPNYTFPFLILNEDGSRFGIGGQSGSFGTLSIFQHIVDQYGNTVSFPQVGNTITLQTNGRLLTLKINDEGNRVAAIIGTGTLENNYYVEVWQFNGTAWSILGSPVNTGLLNQTSFSGGSQVISGGWFSYDGNIFVGRQMAGVSNNARAVQAYKWNGSSWGTIGSQIVGDALNYNFATRVLMPGNGSRIAISGGAGEVEPPVSIYRYIP